MCIWRRCHTKTSPLGCVNKTDLSFVTMKMSSHGKDFPPHWPFDRGNHRQPVDSLHKGPVIRSFDTFVVSANKLLNEQSSFETPWRSCDVIVMAKHIHQPPSHLMSLSWRFRHNYKYLTHWCSNKIAVNWHTTFPNSFSRNTIFLFGFILKNPYENKIIIGSGNGFVPSGSKPLWAPMITGSLTHLNANIIQWLGCRFRHKDRCWISYYILLYYV